MSQVIGEYENSSSSSRVGLELDLPRNSLQLGNGNTTVIDYENIQTYETSTTPTTPTPLKTPSTLQKESQESDTKSRCPNDSKHLGKGEHGKNKMLFEIDDVPSWYLTIFLGFQHYLMMAGATLSKPLLLMPAMCMAVDDPDMGNIISTYLFVSGIVTILQTTFGIRLPVIQGGSFAFILSALSILEGETWKCKLHPEEDSDPTEKWQRRMREIQGAIILASFFQMLLGFFGVFGYIMQRITPITLASAVITIGLSLFNASTRFASKDWSIAGCTIVLVIVFSQYLRGIKIPIPFTLNEKRSGPLRYPMFQLFPVLLSIIIVWALCGILTVSGVYSQTHPSSTAAKWNIVSNSEWFRVPYPFQWGAPTFSASAGLGFLSAVFAGIVESLGEYRAISRIVGAPHPLKHAINRGVFVEGLGCLLMGFFGTGNGTTSYSENTGALSITKVGSRRVIQTAGFLMMIFSLVSVIGAFFMSLPDPIIGGILCVTFSMIVAIGISNLQTVDLTSTRNIFIVGFSVFFGLAMSKWMENVENGKVIDTGFTELDNTFRIFLSTGMFLAAAISLFLDNTIPGTAEERGLGPPANKNAKEVSSSEVHELEEELDKPDTTYDLPFGMKFLQRHQNISSIFPISPTFDGFSRWKVFRRKNKRKV